VFTKSFRLDYNQLEHWKGVLRRTELHSFASKSSEGIFDMKLNDGPKDGECSIDPLNGTLLTLFTINCSHWFDEDGIYDYLFYGSVSSVNPSDQILLVRSTSSITRLRLPLNLHLIVSIGDTLGAGTEYHLLPSVSIDIDYFLLLSFIQSLKEYNSNRSILDVLNSPDDHAIGQMLISLATVLNGKEYAGPSMIELSREKLLIKRTFVDYLSITSLDRPTFEIARIPPLI
jgi:hypothetical protein